MPPITKNLGLIKAIHEGVNPPINIKMLWYNTNPGVFKHFYYDTIVLSWLDLTGGGGGGATWGLIIGSIADQLDLVAALASKENAFAAGTTSQYYRGDKSWQTLDKTAVGLSNVDNTSDVNKPISTAVSTALGLKADLVSGKVPASQLPSYVDDVIEVADYASLPAIGEVGKIYVTLDTNKIYRWSGSTYIEISPAVGTLWGSITGTLSNQTDLMLALGAKENSITAGTITQYWRGDKSWQTLDKTAVGLNNVDNTSDANKPISTATQTALNGKAGYVEYAFFHLFPITGQEVNKIYVSTDDGKMYRWDATLLTYVELSPTATSPTTPDTGGLFFADLATTERLKTCTYYNGTLGVGATLTGNANGLLSELSVTGLIDSVTPTADMLILVKSETSQLRNGLYKINQIGDALTPFILERVTGYDETAEIYPSQITVMLGLTQKGKFFIQTTVDPVIGTSSIVYLANSSNIAQELPVQFVDTVWEDMQTWTYANGTLIPSKPGYQATITAAINQTLMLGIPSPLGKKVLIKDALNSAHNGDYVVTNAGSPTTKWKMQRIGYTPQQFVSQSKEWCVNNIASNNFGKRYACTTNVTLSSQIGTLGLNFSLHPNNSLSHVGSNGIATLDALGVINIPEYDNKWVNTQRHGFVVNNIPDISFDPIGKIFTLTQPSIWKYMRDGLEYEITGNKTVTVTTIDDGVTYNHYITIDSTTGALIASTTVWDLDNTSVLPVAKISWNSSLTPKYQLADERHTCLIDKRMHAYLHATQGTKYESGGTLSNYTPLTDTNASKAVRIATAFISDEDLRFTLNALITPNGTLADYVVYYRESTVWKWKASDMPFVYNTGTNTIQYDSGINMQDASGSNNRYFNSYILFTNQVTPSYNSRFVIISGQGEFTSQANAQAESIKAMQLTGLPIYEWVAMYQITWRYASTNTSKGKVIMQVAPVLINTSVANVSVPNTFAHNVLTGLQGGTVNEYYHITAAEAVVLSNTSNTNSGDETAARIGAIVNGATAYTTPLNADKIGIWDAANSLFKSITWAIIKSTLKTYFDTLYRAVGSIVEGDFAFTDITTANVSITAHGLTPKLPNDAAKYLDGSGAWTTPAGGSGGGLGYTLQLGHTSTNLSASSTYLCGGMIDLAALTLINDRPSRQCIAPKAGSIKYVSIITVVEGTYASATPATTIKVRNLTTGTETTITATYAYSSGVLNNSSRIDGYSLGTPLSVSAGDLIQIRIVTPAWVTAPTTVSSRFNLYIE